jgi:glutamyl-tRNA synthetase
MAPEKFIEIAEPYIRKAVKNPLVSVKDLAALVQTRCQLLSEIPEKLDFFDALPEYDIALYTNKKNENRRRNRAAVA